MLPAAALCTREYLLLSPGSRYYTGHMSTEQTWQTESTSLEATLQLAEQVGRRLKGGEIIVLQGDLGAGKTAFVRGLARGMGSSDTVKSPSFAIANQYHGSRLTLHHFDFYRLDDPGILQAQLQDVIRDSEAVTVIEWAEIVNTVLPADHLTVHLTPTDENIRKVRFEYQAKLHYLIPSIT